MAASALSVSSLPYSMPSQLLAMRPRQCSRFLCRCRRLFCCFWRMLRLRRQGQFRAEARIRQTIFTCYLLLLLLVGIAGIFPAACRRMPRKACRGQVRCRNSNNIKHNIAHVQFRRTIFLEKLKRFAAGVGTKKRPRNNPRPLHGRAETGYLTCCPVAYMLTMFRIIFTHFSMDCTTANSKGPWQL